MHLSFHQADTLSKEIIGAAIAVHRPMGPGLIESIYEPLRFDLLIKNCPDLAASVPDPLR